jgi:hypothetical protein
MPAHRLLLLLAAAVQLVLLHPGGYQHLHSKGLPADCRMLMWPCLVCAEQQLQRQLG